MDENKEGKRPMKRRGKATPKPKAQPRKSKAGRPTQIQKAQREVKEKGLTQEQRSKGREEGKTVNLTIHERAVVKNAIAELYVKGWTYYKMARWITENTEVSISTQSIGKYVNEVLGEWHNERIVNIEMKVTAELRKLNKVEEEAWKAWEASKEDKTRKVTKRKGNVTRDEIIKTSKVESLEEEVKAIGDPRFLEIAIRCVEMRLSWLQKGNFTPVDDSGKEIPSSAVRTVYIEVSQRAKESQQVIDITPTEEN